jgi:exopolysaccharide biosynthesis polyprenyl glycosylphosphotransferase
LTALHDSVAVATADVPTYGEHALGALADSEPRGRGWLMRRLLLAADLGGLLLAFAVAQSLVPAGAADTVEGRWEIALFVASLPFWVVLARVHGLYDRDEERTDHSTVDDIVGVFQVVTLGTWAFLVATRLTGLANPALGRLVLFWMLAVSLVPVVRALMRAVGRRRAAYLQNVLIVGSGDMATELAAKIEKHPEYGLNLLGIVGRDGTPITNGNGRVRPLGTPEDLPELLRALPVDRVIVGFSSDSHEQILDAVRAAQAANVQVDILPRLFEVLGTNTQMHTIEGIPLVGLPSPRLSRSSRMLKRSMDLIGASLGLVLLAPLLVAIAVAIKLDSRGPVFFRQVRMGAGERTFRIFKFRTMDADAEARKPELEHLNMHNGDDPRMFKVPDDPRVTRVGAFLRRWRLDELPQLVNVLRGEMSLVGPRPLILDEDQYVRLWARRRLNLKPGVTGLWQVLGASDIPFEEMTKLDYLYVTNWSLSEDVRLMMRTLPSLARSRAAY